MASLTVSSGFKFYGQHLSGVLLFSQALVSCLPALKSMMFAGSSGSMLLQCDGVTFAVSEMVSVPSGFCFNPVVAALSLIFTILIQAGGCSILWFHQMGAGFS